MKRYGNKGVISSARRWRDKGEKCQDEINTKCTRTFTRMWGRLGPLAIKEAGGKGCVVCGLRTKLIFS